MQKYLHTYLYSDKKNCELDIWPNIKGAFFLDASQLGIIDVKNNKKDKEENWNKKILMFVSVKGSRKKSKGKEVRALPLRKNNFF